MALQDEGVDADAIDLDLWSPTLELLEGKISEEERDEKKRANVSMSEAEGKAAEFVGASRKFEVVIGDSPGGFSAEADVILRKATHAIILCREDKTEETERWKERFGKLGVQIVAILTSSQSGQESVSSNGLVEGTISDLKRIPRATAGVRVVATLLRARLQI